MNIDVLKKFIEFESFRRDEIIKNKIQKEQLILQIEAEIQNILQEIDLEKKCTSVNNDPFLLQAYHLYYASAKNRWQDLLLQMAHAQIELHNITDELKTVHLDIRRYKDIVAKKEREENAFISKKHDAELEELARIMDQAPKLL